MPNWVTNTLEVRGPKADVTRFIESARGDILGKESPLSLAKLLPCPLELKNNKYMSDEMHRWCIEHWGTHWDVRDTVDWVVEPRGEGCTATCAFNTAWAPCDALLISIGPEWPNLTVTLRYCEDSEQFWGVCRVKGDTVLENVQHTRKDITDL